MGFGFIFGLIEQANEGVDSAGDYCKSKVEGKTYTKQYSNQRWDIVLLWNDC